MNEITSEIKGLRASYVALTLALVNNTVPEDQIESAHERLEQLKEAITILQEME